MTQAFNTNLLRTKRKQLLSVLLVIVIGILFIMYGNSFLENAKDSSVKTGINNNDDMHNHNGYHGNDTIRILLWTEYQRLSHWWHSEETPMVRQCGQCTCHFTYNRRRDVGSSDALLFDVQARDLRDNGVRSLPTRHPQGQYWVLYNHEPFIRSRRRQVPRKLFNLTVSYATGADVVLKYGSCKARASKNLTVSSRQIMAGKSELVSWFVSDCNTRSKRKEYVKQLKQHVKVDVYGDCSKNQDLNVGHSQKVGRKIPQDAVDTLNTHKFYLAFENAYCKEYVTEKVFKVMIDGVYTVPIVRGSGPYHSILPRGSYINADDFKSPKQLAAYLTKLDNNETLYLEYFKWRTDYVCHIHTDNSVIWPCAICQKICQLKKNKKEKLLPNISLEKLLHLKCFNPPS